MARKPFFGGNWKSEITGVSEAVRLASNVAKELESFDADVAIFPPLNFLYHVGSTLRFPIFSDIKLGAQTSWVHSDKPRTGEAPIETLLDACVDYILVGHSERRLYCGENDDMVREKLRTILRYEGLTPILCIGETKSEKESNETYNVLKRQLSSSLVGSVSDKLIIAYEPVWAIGAGKPASPEDADEVHRFIRSWLRDKNFSESTRIIYGGSVKPDNIEGFMKMKNIDGALIGGASLKARDFADIIKYKKN